MSEETIILLILTGVGAVCGFLYDFFRAVHQLLKKHDIIVILTDILYWIAITVLIVYVLWRFENLEIRIYQIVGLGIGCVLYFTTISKWIYKIFLIFVVKTTNIIYYIFKIVLTPVHFLYKMVISLFCCITDRFKCRKKKEGAETNVRIEQ